MGFFGLLKFQREKEFAATLANALAQDLPPKFMNDPGKKLSVNKITRSLERTYQNAAQQNSASPMGFFRRSIFANAFKWQLSEKGYTDAFIDLAVEGMIVELNKKR
ncbi:hypothetical protein GN316_09145 [Xylophilus sp. Kf1]|nr:hypothetical protein [Xylophilus sp. Kf1]